MNHLYDSLHLQKHPLAELFVEPSASQVQRGQSLRRILINAILTLSPEPGTPAQSPDWRAYRILELHYIEGLTPHEVMQRLTLGRTLYFKEKARMVEALTKMLWEQWQRIQQERTPSLPGIASGNGENTEFASVQANANIETLRIAQVLDELRSLLEPLAQAKGRRIVVDDPRSDLTVRADRVLLRQAILDVVGRALDSPNVISVMLGTDASASQNAQGILIQVRTSQNSSTPTWIDADLQLCAQLMRLMGGEIALSVNDVRLMWPSTPPPPRTMLVIDDNVSLIDLFRRYLNSHNWEVFGASNQAEAMSTIATHAPDVIVLDVMLPKQDGWEVLRSLKSHEQWRSIPVFICSVMHQPELATTMGAAGYLKKPVTQAQLLRVLAPLA